MDQGRLADIASRHGIELLVQFGSTVTGVTHAGSDVDLAVLLARVPDSFMAYADLVSDLQVLAPDRAIDVALLNHADPLFLKQVMDSALLLYGSDARFQRLRLHAFKRYQDHRRFLQMERAYVDRMIADLGR